MIAENERGHRFHDWHCSGKHAGIMASPRRELALLPGSGDGFLLKRDCSGWLECHAKINVFAIADPALYASGVVCSCPYFASPHFKWIIVLRAPHPRRCKPGADLKTLCSWYAQHRFRQVCFELVKNRLAEAGCNATRHAFNHAPRLSRLRRELARSAISFVSLPWRPGSGRYFSPRLSSSQWSDQFSQRRREFASRRRRSRSRHTT